MPEGEDKIRFELGDIEGIDSLDTARLGLRWALERLRSLEKAASESAKKAEWKLKMRLKAEEEFKSQLDLEHAHLKDVLRQRQDQLEKEYALKLAAWERDYQEMAAQARREGRSKTDQEQADIEDKKAKLEKEYAQRMEAMREVDRRMELRDRALGEREAEFERFCALQKARLESDIVRMEKEAEAKAESRQSDIQRITLQRINSLGEIWEREKALLLSEIEHWKKKVREPD